MTGSINTVVMANNIRPRILYQGALVSASPANKRSVEIPVKINTRIPGKKIKSVEVLVKVEDAE